MSVASKTSVERQLAEFIDKYTPAIADHVRASRARLRVLFPRGFELAYDNYNALVFGFGPTERASDAVLSLAAYPRWVTLFFLKGATLADPGKHLKGSGSRVRSIVLAAPAELDTPLVRGFIDQAVRPVSAKQRQRRPTATA